MIQVLLAFLSFVLGAFGRRIAGGALPQWTPWNAGDQIVRLFFGLTVGVSALLAGVPWYLALALVPATWVGTTTSNFNSMAMGRGGQTMLHDVAGMTLHGVLSAALPALGAWWMGYEWWPIALSGFLIAPLYDLGWRIAGPDGGKGLTWMPRGLQVGTEFGELFWGGTVALGTYLAVLVS